MSALASISKSETSLETTNTLVATIQNNSLENNHIIDQVNNGLIEQGWILLRGFDSSMESFSTLMDSLCSRLTFDPAREYGSKTSQKVNAGTDAVGLHIENGNTPFPPDVVAFYSKKSAAYGSQTTLCDGHQIFNKLSSELRSLLSQKMTVSRRLPEKVWKQYLVNEVDALKSIYQVTEEDLQEMIAKNDSSNKSYLDKNMVLHSCLEVTPIIESCYSSLKAFANTILGPSFNYETPVFTLSNGKQISKQMCSELKILCEQHTHEIQWMDGDIVVIDNTRVMHGRREITVDLETRELYIGMGMR